jgi:hypothetical protein
MIPLDKVFSIASQRLLIGAAQRGLGGLKGPLQLQDRISKQLVFERDEANGQPHLAARHEHHRPKAGWQREDQFSDGTLRLIGLLCSLLEGIPFYYSKSQSFH